MMAFLRIAHAENGMPFAPMDEDKVRAVLKRGIARDHGIIGVIRGKDYIEASIGLFVGTWWYTDANHMHLEDFWCFVHPDHRKSRHAKDMLAFAKWASHKLQYPLLVGVLSNERTAQKVRLYQRQLGSPVGALFVVAADGTEG